MTYKIVNKRGQKVTPTTFKTREQATRHKKNMEKIVGKMPNARIVKTKSKKRPSRRIRRSSGFQFMW